MALRTSNFRIRPAVPGDQSAFIRLYLECWRETYEGLAPTVFAKGLTEEFCARAFTETLAQGDRFLLLSEEGGQPVGFVEGGPERSQLHPDLGEIYSLYLLKTFHGRGLGRNLFQEAVRELERLGKKSLAVWALEGLAAQGFYEKLGGRVFARNHAIPVGSEILRVRSYVWDPMPNLP
jgi:ribosomal protein S18 acetylase RimI-like enzyme